MFPIIMISFRGLRDDLTCILDEELSSMSLCALHCEMRNIEQLLKSIGLLLVQKLKMKIFCWEDGACVSSFAYSVLH